MESSTNIKEMMARKEITVPDYQRAYSWDTEFDKSNAPKQTNVFFSDLEEYCNSSSQSPYYFGHFLFEEKSNTEFAIIDGQQRLSTIVIFLSALFRRLKSIRPLTEGEREDVEDMIKRNSTYRFETVNYDAPVFREYVIEQTRKNKSVETVSAKRIINAFDYFEDQLSDKDEKYLSKMYSAICEAKCSTYIVKNESEAIQMFIFQNNRGKKPSNLEIIKAQFMFYVHLHGGEEKNHLIGEIKTRFEKIYKSISSIEYKIDEDDVLVYTLRVHFNSLWETGALAKINKLLSEDNAISFIKSFTDSLAKSFEYLKLFFGEDERQNMNIHSLITLGSIGVALPFIIKAYTFGIPKENICELCGSLESLVLRHRLIGTRADMTSRINDVYQKFTLEAPDIKPIIERVEYLKNTTEWRWAYWTRSELEKSIQGGIPHNTAKFILWKYENFLETQGKRGYELTRFDRITNPQLEHIAPQTAPNDPLTAGYCEYDEEFTNEYLNCLGNYLLLSGSHNGSIGNIPFNEKRESYTHLAQQLEIQNMTVNEVRWDKDKILARKNKIVEFVLTHL